VNPYSIISVDYNGSWSTFAPELLYDKRFHFGNVATGDFADSLTDPKFIRVQREISEGVEKCRSECGYFRHCGGGCPSNKIAETGTANISVTNHCIFTKMAFVDVVLSECELEYDLRH
jgi:uncharacterized protein